MARAKALRHALAFALRKVHVGPKRAKLDEDTRWQVSGEAIEELRKHGGWKELDEEAPIKMAQAGRAGDKGDLACQALVPRTNMSSPMQRLV
jgi:hypothetical protein